MAHCARKRQVCTELVAPDAMCAEIPRASRLGKTASRVGKSDCLETATPSHGSERKSTYIYLFFQDRSSICAQRLSNM